MLTYATQYVAKGELWPEGGYIEDQDDGAPDAPMLKGRNHDWNFYLIRNLSQAVQAIAA